MISAIRALVRESRDRKNPETPECQTQPGRTEMDQGSSAKDPNCRE